MANFPEFDAKEVQAILETARNHHADSAKLFGTQLNPIEDGHLLLGQSCISVTVGGGKVCVNLPLGIGSICLPIPSFIPDGTVAQACISICTTWGIPTGVKLTVYVAGKEIVQKTFLKC